jgi:hypothetical protein
MPRSHSAAPWDEEGSRAAVRASQPALFIKQYLLPLFFNKTKVSKESTHPDPVVNEEQFWGQSGEVFFGSIHLKGFRITDWFPRAPGLFWSPNARMEREYVYHNRPERDPELGLVYTPESKMGLIEGGGIGTIRLRPRNVDNTLCWFATALTGTHCHVGIPLAIPDSLLQQSGVRWGDKVNLRGRVRFLHDVGLEEVARELRGVRPILVVVDELEGTVTRRKADDPIIITPVALFQTDGDRYERSRYSFVQCAAGSDSELNQATEWIVKYSAKHSGHIITNFDEQKPILADAPLSYQRLVTKTYDKSVIREFTGPIFVERIDKLIHEQNTIKFGDLHMGHNINVTGPSIIAIDSTLNNVSQTISSAPGLNDQQKRDLDQMVQSLRTQLDALKATHADEAKEIADAVDKAVTNASKPPQERKASMLQLSAKGLKEAAQLVGDIAPGVLATAGLIAKFVVGL